jgi:hypothetical protein
MVTINLQADHTHKYCKFRKHEGKMIVVRRIDGQLLSKKMRIRLSRRDPRLHIHPGSLKPAVVVRCTY